MRTKIFLAGIALLSLPLSLPAQAQDKGKNGQGGEKSKSVERKGGAGDAVGRADKGASKAKDRLPDGTGQKARSGSKIDADNGEKFSTPVNRQARPDRKNDKRGNKDGAVIIARGQDVRVDNFRMRTVENGRYIWREPSFKGCPPGLAKKDNGCLPPGQARKLAGFDDEGTRWYRYSNWFSGDRGDDWRYDQGYAYRVDPTTSLVRAILPLLGGALFSGNKWPQSYTDYDVSPYYERYYGSGVNNGIRYADGAIFRVDPETQMIGPIAGLLTGDSWNVGSPAPQGYDLYNVPYDYRDEYSDTESNSYRYNDGYIYEIDPTTQLVRQIIELIV